MMSGIRCTVLIATLLWIGCGVRQEERSRTRRPYVSIAATKANVWVDSYLPISKIKIGETVIELRRGAGFGHYRFDGPAEVTLIDGQTVVIGETVLVAGRQYSGAAPPGACVGMVIFEDGHLEENVHIPWEE